MKSIKKTMTRSWKSANERFDSRWAGDERKTRRKRCYENNKWLANNAVMNKSSLSMMKNKLKIFTDLCRCHTSSSSAGVLIVQA